MADDGVGFADPAGVQLHALAVFAGDRQVWVTKLRILQRYIVRDGLAWSADELKLIDVQYHDVRQDRGLYNRLAASGKIQRLVDEADVQRAITPPTPS